MVSEKLEYVNEQYIDEIGTIPYKKSSHIMRPTVCTIK